RCGCIVAFGVKGAIPSDHKVIRHARSARHPSVVDATHGSYEIADYAVQVCRPGHARSNDRAIAIKQGDSGGGATETLYHQCVGFSSGQREREHIGRRVWRGKQRALAGADEGVWSIVESQQQTVGPLRASRLNANGRAAAVAAGEVARDQILVIEPDPSVGKQLRLEGDSLIFRRPDKESDLVPLDGQMLICTRAQNLEEDIRARLPATCVQVVPERRDGSLSRRRSEIGVCEASVGS